MYTKSVKRNVMVSTLALGIASIFVLPSNAAAQRPVGSYQKSCTSISMTRDGYLQASCKTVNGSWQQTRIRVSECRGGDIANNNGRLVCASGRSGDNRGNQGGWSNSNGRGRGHDKHDHDGKKGRGHDGRDRDWDRDGDRDRDRSSARSGVILYSGKNFSGRTLSVRNDYGNLRTTGFNDAVSSIRIVGRGTWRFCSDRNYGGRCVNVSSDVRDMNRLAVRTAVSSIQRVR